MHAVILETRLQGRDKQPGEYCLRAESALPEKVVMAHFSILLSAVLHHTCLYNYVHFAPDVQFEYVHNRGYLVPS